MKDALFGSEQPVISMSALLLAAVAALGLALASCIQDLYGIFRSQRCWIPVNAPPKMIGDDYHYFGLLTLLHRRFLNRLLGMNLRVIPFSIATRFQMAGMLVNLLPYSVGYLFGDRRYGILGVRLFNRYWLFLGAMLNALLVVPGGDPDLSVIIAAIVTCLFFLFYPPPVTSSFKLSIAWNLGNRRHALERASSNDLTRAMFSETSGPLIVWILFFCLVWIENGTSLAFAAALTLTTLAFFTYWPISVVAVFLVLLSGILAHQWLVVLIIPAFLCATMLYYRTLRTSATGEAFFVGKDPRKSVTFDRNLLANTRSTLFASLLILGLSLHFGIHSAFAILMFGLSVFVLFRSVDGHHLSRVWERGAQIPFALLLTVQSAALILAFVNLSRISVVWPAVLLLLLVMIICLFEYNQATFLWNARANLLDEAIVEKLYARRKGTDSRTIATESIEEANAILLYSCDWTDLHNFSIQSGDTESHLYSILRNFKTLGWSQSEVIDVLTIRVDYVDWLNSRPIGPESEAGPLAYAHTLQFWATNREYNHWLTQHAYYDVESGWSSSYRSLLLSIWIELDSSAPS